MHLLLAALLRYHTTSVISWRSHYFLLCHFYHIKTVITLNRNCWNYYMRTKMERLKKNQKYPEASETERRKSRAPNANRKMWRSNFDKSFAETLRINSASSSRIPLVSFYLFRGVLLLFFSACEIIEQWRLCRWCFWTTSHERIRVSCGKW